jgi:hypothetical protein
MYIVNKVEINILVKEVLGKKYVNFPKKEGMETKIVILKKYNKNLTK